VIIVGRGKTIEHIVLFAVGLSHKFIEKTVFQAYLRGD